MGRTVDVASIVQQAVEEYARGDTWKASTFALSDTVRYIYAVLVVPEYPRQSKTGVVVMARIVRGRVLIDEDITDVPLVTKLEDAGIPRDRIVLLYAGEQLPPPGGTGLLWDDSV